VYFWLQGRSNNVVNIQKMIELIRSRNHNFKISIELEKPRAVLKELLPLGDVVFISKEFAKFSGYQSMEEAVKGFSTLVKFG
jgi:hypothetical protein